MIIPGAARSFAPGVVLALLLLACAEDPAPTPGEFIAIERDFAGFDQWTVFDRGSQPVGLTHPDGSSFVYVSALPPSGATEFPVGTMIVRITTGLDPATWEAHAMVKRGGDYNADGARGWEFFDLQLGSLEPPVAPTIRWRGVSPAMGDGYVIPDGGAFLSCNHCHGSAVDNDSVLGPELDLRSL